MIKEIEIEDNISLVKVLYKAWVVDGYSMARRYMVLWKVKVNNKKIEDPQYKITKKDFDKKQQEVLIQFNKQKFNVYRD